MDPFPTPIDPRPNSAVMPCADIGEPPVIAVPSLGLFSMQVDANEVQNAGAQHVDADAEDLRDDYGCPIEEEQPSPINTN